MNALDIVIIIITSAICSLPIGGAVICCFEMYFDYATKREEAKTVGIFEELMEYYNFNEVTKRSVKDFLDREKE